MLRTQVKDAILDMPNTFRFRLYLQLPGMTLSYAKQATEFEITNRLMDYTLESSESSFAYFYGLFVGTFLMSFPEGEKEFFNW